jgi:hypothetical protein
MAEHGSDHHHGEMDIREQESTFHLFMGLTKWGSLLTAALLLFLTLLFCTRTGFPGSFAAAAAVTALGVILLRDGSEH